MRLFRRSPQTDEATSQALTRTKKSFFGRIGSLFGGGDITEELWESLEEVLIGADAGVATTMDVLERVRGRRPRDAEAVRALPWRGGRVQVFVHGEAHEVMHGIRPYLVREREVPRADLSISGYWRRGRTEEGFREWKSELAATEG